MASPSSQGRRRTPGKTSTEDQALNVIASEAEARLAAKRAARAEARIIRMKELEKKQQEADEKMDREYQRSLNTDEPLKPRASRASEKALTRITPTVENEMNGPLPQETQIRSLQDNIRDINEKYKKAMVSNAQLDNEKQALAYQVDCLKDRLEEAEEVIENLKQEILDKTRELSRVKMDNKNYMEELEKAREQLVLRDKLLEEHGIPTDGSEQPDLSQAELSARMQDSVNVESGDFDVSGTSKSRESSRRSSAPDDRDALLEQIKALKDQVSDLRRNPEYDDDRMRDFESLQTSGDRTDLSSTIAGQDFEKSETFEDVTDEAREIDDQLRSGLIVNNNERNEDYEVIDQNLRQGEVSNFEDNSFERSSGLTVSVGDSIANSYLESFRSNLMTESVESEKPLEISITAAVDDTEPESPCPLTIENTQTEVKQQSSDKDLVEYDIVETSTVATKQSDSTDNEEVRPGNILQDEEKPVHRIGDDGTEAKDSVDSDNEKQIPLDIVDVTAESQKLFESGQAVQDLIISADEAAGSDIVDIELANVSASLEESELKMEVLAVRVEEAFAEAKGNQGESSSGDARQIHAEELPLEKQEGSLNGSTTKECEADAQSNISNEVETTEIAKEDDDGFDNIDTDEVFVDARSELSDKEDLSPSSMEENFKDALEADVEHYEEVHLPDDDECNSLLAAEQSPTESSFSETVCDDATTPTQHAAANIVNSSTAEANLDLVSAIDGEPNVLTSSVETHEFGNHAEVHVTEREADAEINDEEFDRTESNSRECIVPPDSSQVDCDTISELHAESLEHVDSPVKSVETHPDSTDISVTDTDEICVAGDSGESTDSPDRDSQAKCELKDEKSSRQEDTSRSADCVKDQSEEENGDGSAENCNVLVCIDRAVSDGKSDEEVCIKTTDDIEHDQGLEKAEIKAVSDELEKDSNESGLSQQESSVDEESKEPLPIPEKDYPINEETAGESSGSDKKENAATASQTEETVIVNASHAGGDQLLAAFETRKRLGSLSPGSSRREIPAQPVPKERKKKKKKNKKKGTVKMLVKELVANSFDSDGSGSDLTKEVKDETQPKSESLENKDDQIHVKEGETEELRPHESEESEDKEGGFIEGDKDIIEGEGGESLDDSASIEQSDNSQNDMLSVEECSKDAKEEQSCDSNPGVSCASEASDAEMGAKAKGKHKPKKDSKKDGCKNQ